MTLNEIVKSLNDIATDHLQINHFFFGDEWDFATSGVVNCPAMITVLEPATLEGSTITHTFKIYIGDLVQKDLSNKVEVLSDCQLIALDIIYQLQLETYDFVLINKSSIQLTDFEDSFDAELYGYWFQIKLKLPAPYDRCAIPLASITPAPAPAPAPAFSPSDLAGLQLWLKADEGVTLNGSNVSQWDDYSGNSNNAIQATATNQPIKVDNILNGKPVIRFDGVDDFMAFTEITTNRTVFFVFNHSTGTQDWAPILGHSQLSHWHGGSGANLFSNYTSHEVQNGLAFVNAVSTPILSVLKYTDYTVLAIITTGNTSSDNIGSDRFYGGRYWDGDYVEIIIYDNELSSADRIDVETYLSDKYAI